jgi:SAM-dependent methyltransferase
MHQSASANRARPIYAHAPAAAAVNPLSTCPVCHDENLLRQAHNLTYCVHCEHIFQTDLSVTAVYDANYAHKYDNYPHREISSIRWKFIQQTLSLPPGSKILDIGYGNGSFLKYAREHGMHIFGIDLHGEDFGIPETDYKTDTAFDLVCFFDSLEHFDTFAQPLALKAKNVVVSVPDPPEDFLFKSPCEWRHYRPGEHLHYFSRFSLDLLMHRWGLSSKRAEGHPEDALRGKLTIGGQAYDNIYTAIYSRADVL